MYAIANIIYGIPLVKTDEESKHSEALKDLLEESDNEAGEAPSFISYYSGSAEVTPCAWGLELGYFDEGCAFVEADKLFMRPTNAQIAMVNEAFAALPEALRAEISEYGPIRVFALWSTS